MRPRAESQVVKSVLVGTSGWHYKHWLGPFYPERLPPEQMLSFYSEHFDTVELNTTFYRLPPAGAAAQWKKNTPAGFCFAAKGSRFLTHMKKLRDPELGVERFFDHLSGLGKKLGPIVFQLPPQWPVNIPRLEAFLAVLPRRRRYAFEFRNPTWNTGAVYDLLGKNNMALCIFDLAGVQSPIELTADFTYIRLHGPGGKYQGSYDDAALRDWADRIKTWRLPAAYVYFDNDQAGYAPKNAARLREILDGSKTLQLPR
ncbi:MAG TPA: DUF72 domain-containing protein [Bryobacteraceae bacterium]|nr:DUF72 domain-containing protein [Bryobacteraceae bacterium]